MVVDVLDGRVDLDELPLGIGIAQATLIGTPDEFLLRVPEDGETLAISLYLLAHAGIGLLEHLRAAERCRRNGVPKLAIILHLLENLDHDPHVFEIVFLLFLRGLIAWRGSVFPVIDLALLGL